MSQIFKQLIATIIIITALGTIYFGAYLPLRKGQTHVDAIGGLQKGNIKSIADFNDLFDKDLNFYSPVGQDEVKAHYLDILANVINQQDNEQIVYVLISQAEKSIDSILRIKKGFSFNQDLYVLGLIYKTAGIKFKDNNYYQKAENIFNEGLEYSPKRLLFLRGLFDLYSVNKDAQDKALEIGKTILEYYPNETKVREFVENIKT
jgi:tetratricopeptide (TPR) repeat protein